MSNKKMLNKILSSALTVVFTAQYAAAFPYQANAAYDGTEYVIYSSDDTVINTKSAVIDGNVYTGNTFSYSGDSVCNVNELLNAHKLSGEIKAQSNADLKSEIPDISEIIKSDITFENVNDGDYTINGGKLDISQGMLTKGRLKIKNAVFSGTGCVKAEGSISYDAVQNADDCKLLLCSEKGDITIQGTDLTINGVIYAPNGKVEINAKHLTLNGAIIAKSTELNGTDVRINKVDDFFGLFEKEHSLDIKGIDEKHRENRKITLDITDAIEQNELDKSSVVWKFTASDDTLKDTVKIDETTSDEAVKNFIVTKAGEYTIGITAKDKDGKEVTFSNTLVIDKDIAPVAAFWTNADVVERDGEGNAVFELEDTSYSLDGDTIDSRIWSVAYDSDNDGDFSDEKEVVISSANETKLTYTVPSVGKYQFRLKVSEHFDDTIPSLLPKDAYLSADSLENDKNSNIKEVTNIAPYSGAVMSKAKNIDIVFTAETPDADDLNTINANIEEIKDELEKKGFHVNVSTLYTSTLTARDRFAWTEYDHYYYEDAYVSPAMDKHIIYENGSIKMVGYTVAPLRDWLFVDDGINAVRVLTFDMVRDETDWHSMEGGGFLFNTSIKDGKVIDPDTNEEKVVSMMNGYLLLLSGNSFKLIELKDIETDKFRDGAVAYSAETAGKLLTSVPVNNPYQDFSIRIVTSDRSVSVFADDEPIIEDFELPETETGTGFGPIVCHASHSCTQQSYFTFSNIRMTTVVGSKLTDILNDYKWRNSAEHFLINLSKDKFTELENEEYAANVIKSLNEKDINMVGIGSEFSKNQYSNVLRAADGVYIDWYDLLKDKELLKKYIESVVSANDYDIKDNTITLDDEVSFNDFYADKENDPIIKQYWEYELDASVFENIDKESGVTVKDLPRSIFESAGKYNINSKVKDDPTNGNDYLSDYEKWSEEKNWADGLIVHRKPKAEIKSELFSTEDPKKYICSLSFNGYDPDAESKPNKGISKELYQWKCVDDQEWREGTIPQTISSDKVYIQKYMVCDEMGQWSDPCIEVIRGKSNDSSAAEFKDEIPPEVELSISEKSPLKGDTIVVSVSAKDNNNVEEVVVKANNKVIANYQGSCLYTCNATEDVVFTVECKDFAGNTATVSETITVGGPHDSTPPKINVNHTKDITVEDGRVTIKGSITDETLFSGYNVKCAVKDSDEYTEVFSSDKEVENGEIAVFDLPSGDADAYTVLIEAADAEGNKYYSTYNLDLSSGKLRTTYSSKSEKAVMEKRVDIPAEITLEASAYKAEVGDTVIINVDAVDKDGLTKVETRKNNSLIFSKTGEIRLSETKPQVVTITTFTFDSFGGRSQKSIEIEFIDSADHTPPTAEITSPTDSEILSGKVSVKGSVSDETAFRNYKLEYKKEFGNFYIPILSSEQIRDNEELGIWDTYPLDDGVYELRLTATDKGGNISYSSVKCQIKNGAVMLDVPVDEEGNTEDFVFIKKPEKNIPADKVLKIEAQTNRKSGDCVFFMQKDSPDSKCTKIKEVRLQNIDDYGMAFATVDTSMYDEGTYTITAVVMLNGNYSISAKTTAEVKHSYTADKDELYICTVNTPDENAKISGVYEVSAEVTPDVFKYFKFEYAPAGTDNYTIFDKGKLFDNSEVYSTLDTTLIPSGNYDIRFTAFNDDTIATDSVPVEITGNMKLGQCVESFDDIAVDLGGVPVIITRTYDSRTRERYDDFGFGWKLSISGAQNDSVTVTDNGITSSNGESITFTRDNEGRITEITTNSDEKFTYEYNGYGDLVLVNKNGKQQNRYTYKNNYLSEIRNNRNSVVKKIFYTTSNRVMLEEDGAGKITKYHYDLNNKEVIVTDRKGGVTKYVFDNFGNVISETDANGNVITKNYDENGKLVSAVSASGNTYTYNYDENGELVSMTDADGNEFADNRYQNKNNVSFDSNAFDLIGINFADAFYETSIIDISGDLNDYLSFPVNRARTLSVPDGAAPDNSNVVSLINDDGDIISFSYNEDGRCVSKTLNRQINGINRVSTEYYLYDVRGNIVQITDSYGNVMNVSYTNTGKVEEITNAKSGRIKYEYDNLDRVKRVICGNSSAEIFTYDDEGNILTVTDRNGKTTTMEYDGVGNLLSKTFSDASVESYEYDNDYNLIKKTDRNGSVTTYEYDKTGRNTAVIDCYGGRTEYTYNSDSMVTAIKDPNGNTFTYAYDANGNLTSVTYQDGTSELTDYDERGRVVGQTDQNGYTTSYSYDNADRLVEIKNALGGKTTYTYDESGNITSASDANGHTSSYEYGENGKVVKITNAAGKTAEMEYDELNNVSLYKDFDEDETKYQYSPFNLTTKRIKDNDINYNYQGNGKIMSARDKWGNYSFAYDDCDNITSITYPDGNHMEMTYDFNDRMTEIKTEDDYISYTYDDLDRVISSTDNEGNKTEYKYDSNGNLAKISLPDGTKTEFSYDSLNRLISISDLDSDDKVTSKYEYTLGKAGEILSVSGTDSTVEYTYDALYMVKTEKMTDSEGKVTECSYEYDNVGNMTSKKVNGTETVYKYNELDQLIQENDIVYEYDDAGNLTTVTYPDKTLILEYNHDNQLIRSKVQQGEEETVEEYEYDFTGNLIRKKNGDEITSYFNDIAFDLPYIIADLNSDTRVLTDKRSDNTKLINTLLGKDEQEGIMAEDMLHKYLYANSCPLAYYRSAVRASSMLENTITDITDDSNE